MLQKRFLRHALLGAALLILGLTACGEPAEKPPAVTYSPDEAATVIQNMGETAGNILEGAAFGLTERAADAMFSPFPESATPNQLPRGIYVWNEGEWEWEFLDADESLILRWPASGDTPDAQLTVDWGTTVYANDELGDAHEVPENPSIDVQIDGVSVGQLSSAVTWQNVPGCGVILEPANLTASGAIGDDSGRFSLDNFRITIPRDSGAVSFSGKVTASAGADTLSFQWGLTANGTIERDPASCFLEDVTVNSGSVDVEVSVNDESLGLAFNFSGVTLDEYRLLESVTISGGALKVNGSVAVAFEGTLNSDTLFGSQLNLRFANGEEMTLLEYLASFESLGSMAVRRLLR